MSLVDSLFEHFHEQLAEQGYVARAGQMVDATFVEVPRQRNTREENATIKAGEVPEAWDQPEAKAKRRQKDTEARWTKKNNERHYGYKNHINADQQHKLIQSYSVTPASVHDSQVFDDLLDQTKDKDGNKRAVYADSAYRSQAQEQRLSLDRRAETIEPEQIQSTGQSRACLWRSGSDGWASGAQHRYSAGKGEDWADEFGLQHDALGATN